MKAKNHKLRKRDARLRILHASQFKAARNLYQYWRCFHKSKFFGKWEVGRRSWEFWCSFSLNKAQILIWLGGVFAGWDSQVKSDVFLSKQLYSFTINALGPFLGKSQLPKSEKWDEVGNFTGNSTSKQRKPLSNGEMFFTASKSHEIPGVIPRK